jgi:butyryl-CoA dehydrogenase
MLLNDDQRMIRDRAKQFSKEQLAPFSAEWDRSHAFPAAALQRIGQVSMIGMLVLTGWDGAGLDYISYDLAIEELAAGDGATSTIMGVHNSVGCMPILKFGNDVQKERFLRPMARGESLGAFCLTEPQAGSDASTLRTRARRMGRVWVLSGSKQFITSGKNAKVALVFAETDPEAGKKGFSAFIVPTDTLGYCIAGIERKMGQHGSDTAHIALNDCFVGPNLLLGKEGESYKIALSNLEGGRIGIASQCVGIARAIFEAAVAYARERKSFGVAIDQHQAMAFRLADMCMRIDVARQMVLHVAALREAQPLSSLGLDGEAVRLGGARVLRWNSDPRRIRLSPRLSRRKDLPRCACLPDLRGHQRHPADRNCKATS